MEEPAAASTSSLQPLNFAIWSKEEMDKQQMRAYKLSPKKIKKKNMCETED